MPETNGAAAPLQTADEVATGLPGREEVLKLFAGDILAAQPGTKTVADDPALLPGESEQTQNDLSQTDLGQQTETAVTTEPAWTAAQAAWFAQAEKAVTPEEKAAAAKAQPAFSEAEIAWLHGQDAAAAKAADAPAGEDHLKDDAELKGKLDPKTQERINGRIGKEVAKTKAAAERAEAAEARLAEVEQQLATRPGPDARTAGPLATVHTQADVQAAAAQATEALEQAEDLLGQLKRNPALVERTLRSAKVELRGEDGAEDYSPAQMEEFLTGVKTNADRTLRRELPKRVEFLQRVDASAAEATALIPELKDPKSPQRKLADQILTTFPQIRQLAHWPKMVALALLGMEVEKSRATAATTANQPRRKLPIPTMIPTPRGAAPSNALPKAQPNGVTDETASAALNGDRKARLKLIQTFVPR